MSLDETRLIVDGCLAGDSSAMRALVRRYEGQVFGLCYRMLSQRQDAEDMAQETFVRVLKSLHTWDQTRAFEPWLLAIAGNRCRTMLSRRKKRPAACELPEHVADESPAPQEADNLGEEIRLALSGLREEYRQAFELFHEQQLSYGEIAEALDCPLGTVKTWVHRARRELVEFLQRRGVVEAKSRDKKNEPQFAEVDRLNSNQEPGADSTRVRQAASG